MSNRLMNELAQPISRHAVPEKLRWRSELWKNRGSGGIKMLEPTEEQRLLAAVAGGDRRAAEELVSSTYSQVFASLMRMVHGDRELAADLTHDTYRKAWKALPTFDRRSRLSTWLFRIAYTTFLNHRRGIREAQPLDHEQILQVVDPKPGQDERLDRQEIALRLRRAVLGLPEELRFTVTARFWAELSVEEIARVEKVTGAAIRKRLKNAKTRLHQALKAGEEEVA